MIGIFINVGAVILGGILGTLFGKKMTPEFTAEMNKVFGISAMCMGVASTRPWPMEDQARSSGLRWSMG